MQIRSLQISNLRNLTAVNIKETGRINIVHGENGSGKTSFLEAIYCLGFGRSFRTHQARQMIQAEAEAFTVFAQLTDKFNNDVRVGFGRNRQGETDSRINGERGQRFSELARYVPVQLITPEGVELITDGPKVRRQFMDWGLFHVEQSDYLHWIQYSRFLKQRNALLRTGRFMQDGGTFWDQKLAESGDALTKARQNYLDALNENLNSYCQQFLPEMEFSFKLLPGWAERFASLEEALADRLELDLRQGFTSVGPSKAEWQIRVDGADARERLSRGQLKLLMAALRFVQGEHYRQATGTSCIYLIDDLPAELDVDNQRKLCQAIIDTESQVFVTAIDKKSIFDHFSEAETKLFHVEHGALLETTTG